MSVCARIRRILHVDKTGHAGTLDPMAEGVLPVALGRACKSVEHVGDGTKIYEAGLLLGVTTDTQDITGKVLTEFSGRLPSKEEVENAILSFDGGYDQLTPMYSARQVDGRRLYDIARSGEEVDRPVRHIDILGIKVNEMHLPHVVFTVKCSKGTYVRTLCEDIGKKLTCGACMESLKRTAVGDFLIEDTLTIPEIEKLSEEGKLDSVLRVTVPTAVAIGKFDGTHIGHQALLRELRKTSEKHHLRSLVLLLTPEGKTVEEKEEKREYLLSLGIDYVIDLPLDENLRTMRAETFLKDLLIKRLGMQFLVGGKDITFGYQKEGNEQYLREHAGEFGFHYRLIDKVKLEQKEAEGEQKEISSSMLREELTLGHMETAAKILGRPFAVTGEVIHGMHMGTDVFTVPTMNISVPENVLLPPYGVYAVRITIFGEEDKKIRNDHTAPKGKNAKRYEGIADLGVKPTIAEGLGPCLEAFAFTEEGETLSAYGKKIGVEFLHYLREEKKFCSPEELKMQILEKDIPAAREYFGKKS